MPTPILRNTQARYLYGVLVAATVVVGGVAVLGAQRWVVLGGLVAAWVLALRYLVPGQAELGARLVSIRWPLRRVVVEPQTLRRVVHQPSVVSPHRFKVAVAGAAPFLIVLTQFDDPQRLAAALSQVVGQAPGLTGGQRQAALAALGRV